MKQRIIFLLAFFLALTTQVHGQIGDYRNVFSIGVNGGYMFTSVGFSPKVSQSMLGCPTAGVTLRYTSEKYFTAICSLVGEVNWAQMGWNEKIITINREPVYNYENGEAEFYRRHLTYIQIPLMAHLAWGREVKGVNFFIEIGPQFGFCLGESTDTNFTTENMNVNDRGNQTTAQYDMPVEHKFDYGIVGGLGIEYSHPAVGHFRIEGRYYYGLGNIYGASKKDYFGKSNQSAIEVKIAYLVDITSRRKAEYPKK